MTLDLELQRRRIAGSRRAVGLSRQRVEELGALTGGALTAIERGTRSATVPEIVGIAHATGVPARYLTGHTGVVFRTCRDDGAPNGVRDRMDRLLATAADLDAVLGHDDGPAPRTWGA